MDPASLLSLTLSCPAVGATCRWLLRLPSLQAEEALRQCLASFREGLEAAGLVTLEKGELTSGQELLAEGLLFHRLAEWQARLARCEAVEQEQGYWEQKMNAMRVEYIREIELYRLKLRCLERNLKPPDLRSSAIKGRAEVEVQTEMKSPFGETLQLWDKAMSLQQRLDAVHQRNMAFEEVEDCIFALHRAILDDDKRLRSLEKALLEACELLAARTLDLDLGQRLAEAALDGRDVLRLTRAELLPEEPQLAAQELEEALSVSAMQVLEAALRGSESRSEPLVLRLRRLARQLQGIEDSGEKAQRRSKDPVATGLVSAALLGGSRPARRTSEDWRLQTIWKALGSAKELQTTLELVKTAASQWKSLSKAKEEQIQEADPEPEEAEEEEEKEDDLEIPEAQMPVEVQAPVPAPSPPIEPEAMEVRKAFSEAEPANPPDPAPAPPVLEQEASEHIIMPQEDRDSATSDADTQVFGQWAQLAQAAANRVHSESGLSEMELARPIMAEAATMTPSHWLAKALLNSEDVEWTSVPLGSAKDFQWSLMPLARESPESSDEEGPARHELRSEPARAARARSASAAYQRMNSILECTWPRSVLATRVPGGPWPSIFPAAWSRIGGGLELARLTSKPGLARRRILSDNASAAEAPAPSASPSAPSFAPAEDLSAALTLTPLTPLPPKAEACAPPASPRRAERRRLCGERRRTEPGGRSAGVQRPSLVSVEDPAPVQEFFVTAGGSSDSFHNVTTEFERQDSEVVERWLNKLREPLPMVAKLELDEVNQEPRRAGTLASLTSWQGEPSPRSPRHLQSCESVLIPVEDCPASRPSTAERRGPREANVGHAGHVFRPWTGGDVLRPKPRAKELRPQSAPEVPSHPRSAPTAREAHPAGAEAEAEVNFLPRAPAMCPKTQLRRIGRPASASTATSSRPSTPGRVHVAYVIHRPKA